MEVQTSQTSSPLSSLYDGLEQKKLEFLIGRWRIEGRTGEAAPTYPKAEVTGEETYEWLAGRFFMLYRWDRAFEHSAHKGIGVFGYDQESKKYYLNTFDNLGYARVYNVDVKGRTINVTGPWERATITVSDDGMTMRERWERTTDGTNWQMLCELKGIKAGRR